jgi:hypothetical protein
VRFGLLVLALASCERCDRGVGPETRPVLVNGLPGCPPKSSYYARPLVVRFDRDRALFEEPFDTQTRVDSPSIPTLTVPRQRMKATIRVGLCTKTSVATWDCNAAQWLVSTSVHLDGRSTAFPVSALGASIGCVSAAP